MSDRKHWERKHRESEFLGESSTFLEECLSDLGGGLGRRALDVASGLGRNALRLAERGFQVDAFDWSVEGARKLMAAARLRDLPVQPVVCDLTRFPIPRDRYDVVAVFRFLDRSLWRPLALALKPGGALIVETYTMSERERHPSFPREFCLEEGELLRAFAATTRVARYRELPSEPLASLLAFRASREGRREAAARL